MVRAFFLCLLVSVAQGAVPPLLHDALEGFRTEPPRGWSFTQTTVAEGKSTVERCDAAKPEFERWTLLQKDGRTPTAEELAHYGEMRSRRSRGGTAPKLAEQLDLANVEVVSENSERAVYRCPIKRSESGDKTADFLRASLVVHVPTRSIASVELASTGKFSPALAVSISEMKTVMTYQPSEGDTPARPLAVTTHVRGTAFWFKSLDADMTVTFSDYVRVGKR